VVDDPARIVPWVDAGRSPHDGDPMPPGQLRQLLLTAQAAGLQRFRWLVDEQVFQLIPLDYDLAIQLAQQWQKKTMNALPALLMLWPAMAIISAATHFLSFDGRTRSLARKAGLKLLPEKLGI